MARLSLRTLGINFGDAVEPSRVQAVSMAAPGFDFAVENFRVWWPFDMQHAGQTALGARQGMIDQHVIARHIDLEFRDDGTTCRNRDGLHTAQGSLSTPPRLYTRSKISPMTWKEEV